MVHEVPAYRVEVSFAGCPPQRRVERASGVSELVADGAVLRCVVTGSFQPFLEALHGHEVLMLQSTPQAKNQDERGQVARGSR
jgi:hypothetical protein